MTGPLPVGRLAPSPSGRLHVGHARTFLLAWWHVRARGGRVLLRLEDLDRVRVKPGASAECLADLEWLGLDWDGEVWKQSERKAIYDDALAQLARAGRAYECWCSRAEVARAASAPHVGEDGPLYPGTCRAGGTPKPGRSPSWRFRVEPGVETFEDALHGVVRQDVEHEVGDFTIRRIDGVASYQLAVVVDDALAGVTHVLRGEDLLSSTGRQLQIQKALGYSRPGYAHVPLLMQRDGKRLAKRDGASTVVGLRELGWSPERVVGQLAAWSGLGDGSPVSARELVRGFSIEGIKRDATVVP